MPGGGDPWYKEIMREAATTLAPMLRALLYGTAVANLVLGTLFLFAPELGLTLWPTPISPVLIRFIGAILIGNGMGAGLAARQGTWEGARVLFAVGLVYGVIVLVAVPIQILAADAHPALWGYVGGTALFVIPMAWIFATHERRR